MKINKLYFILLFILLLSCRSNTIRIDECEGCLFDKGRDIIHLTTISEFPEYTFINMHELNSTDARITDDSIYLQFNSGFEDTETYVRLVINRNQLSGSFFLKNYNAEWEQHVLKSETGRLVLSKMTNGRLCIGGSFEAEIDKKTWGYDESIYYRKILSFLVTVPSDSTKINLHHESPRFPN